MPRRAERLVLAGPVQRPPYGVIETVLHGALHAQSRLQRQLFQFAALEDTNMVGAFEIDRGGDMFLHALDDFVRDRQQKQSARPGDAWKNFHGDDPTDYSIVQRYRIGIGNQCANAARALFLKPRASGIELIGIDVGENDLGPLPGAKEGITAFATTDIEYYIFSRYRKATNQLACVVLQPAALMNIDLGFCGCKHLGSWLAGGLELGR